MLGDENGDLGLDVEDGLLAFEELIKEFDVIERLL